jgi:hypothetical protein
LCLRADGAHVRARRCGTGQRPSHDDRPDHQFSAENLPQGQTSGKRYHSSFRVAWISDLTHPTQTEANRSDRLIVRPIDSPVNSIRQQKRKLFLTCDRVVIGLSRVSVRPSRSPFEAPAGMLFSGRKTAARACGAVGSALPWHGRGRRFEPDQVHQLLLTVLDSVVMSPLKR